MQMSQISKKISQTILVLTLVGIGFIVLSCASNSYQSMDSELANADIETLKDLFGGLETLENISEQSKREHVLSEFDIEKYVEAWSQPGAIQAGLHYYRASVKDAFTTSWDGIINVPTLVMHGMKDIALTPKILNGLEEYVKDLKIVRIENATHWVMIDAPDKVNSSIKEFIGD